MVLVLLGKGEAYYKGERLDGAKAMAKARIKIFKLKAKNLDKDLVLDINDLTFYYKKDNPSVPSVLTISVADGTGYIQISWFYKIDVFNKILQEGREYIFCGKPYIDVKNNNRLKMNILFFNVNINKFKRILNEKSKIDSFFCCIIWFTCCLKCGWCINKDEQGACCSRPIFKSFYSRC